MPIDIVLLIENLLQIIAKVLKLNHKTWLKSNGYKNLIINLTNQLLISFILYWIGIFIENLAK